MHENPRLRQLAPLVCNESDCITGADLSNAALRADAGGPLDFAGLTASLFSGSTPVMLAALKGELLAEAAAANDISLDAEDGASEGADGTFGRDAFATDDESSEDAGTLRIDASATTSAMSTTDEDNKQRHRELLPGTLGWGVSKDSVALLRGSVNLGAKHAWDGSAQNASYSHASAIRSALILDGSGYDKAVSPNSGHTPVNVSGIINLYKGFDIDVQHGTLSLSAYVQLFWQDIRLQWDPDDYGGVAVVSAYCDTKIDVGQTEIWVPDFDVYNMRDSLKETLSTQPCAVSYNGFVSWRRPGRIEASCDWVGLEKFPFDKPSCSLILGSQIYSSDTQLLWTHKGGLAMRDVSDSAAASKYQQFTLFDATAEATLDRCGTGIFCSILKLDITFRRASNYYVFKVLLPSILLALASMLVFWTSVECGERLGYGMTTILAMLATDVWTSEVFCNGVSHKDYVNHPK